MNVLTAENIHFAVGHVALLDGSHFALGEREKVGLIGRNGTGKSSLLKILAGLIVPDEGTVSRQSGLKVVYVAQEPPLDADWTVFDAVAEGLGAVRDILRRYHALNSQLSTDFSEEKLNQLNKLQSELESVDGWQFDALIKRTISQLGLPENETIGALSGGQKKRVALAQAWVQNPDILLLDEPTNHLDIDGIGQMENLLQQFSGSLILISHDRRFLDNTVQRIVELDRGQLHSYAGNFAEYRQRKEAQMAVEDEHNRLFDKFHAQEEAWIRKGIEARRTRNQGRVKRLEDLRRQRAARRERQGNVSLQVESGEQSGKIVTRMENVDFTYGDQNIIEHFSCLIQRGDKIGLIGANGVGKTTFLRLVLGELAPTQGKVDLGSKIQVAYFDQFRSELNPSESVFDTIGQGNDFIDINGQKKHVIGYLADFLFPPERARSPVSSLSGGERNRLLLAKLFTRSANVLVLDEPTNDLDIETQELLENLLQEYDGTLFLVSHDRQFLDNVITHSIVFNGSGCLKEYIGGYQDYLDTLARESTIQTPPATTPKKESKEKPRSRRSEKLSFNEQRELANLPQIIADLEQEQADLQEKLLNPEIFKNDYLQAAQWQQRIGEIEEALLTCLERWTTLEEKQ